MACSPDGTCIASASGDDTLKLWDAATGRELRTLKGHVEGVSSVAFNKGGTRLASGTALPPPVGVFPRFQTE